ARFLAGLDVLARHERSGGARVYVGANTPATVARAAKRGHSVLVSALNPLDVCRNLISAHRAAWDTSNGQWPGVLAYRNIWVTERDAERAAALDWVRASYIQYAGLGLTMSAPGGAALDFTSPEDDTLRAVVDTTITGSPSDVTAQLVELKRLGVTQVAFRLILDGAPRFALEEQM